MSVCVGVCLLFQANATDCNLSLLSLLLFATALLLASLAAPDVGSLHELLDHPLFLLTVFNLDRLPHLFNLATPLSLGLILHTLLLTFSLLFQVVLS